MGRPADKRNTPVEHRPLKPFNAQFRLWASRKLFAVRCERIEEHIRRFEVMAPYLSTTEYRHIDFVGLGETTGYAPHLLRDTAKTIAAKGKLLEYHQDNEGAWWSLAADPYLAPPEVLPPHATPEEERPVPVELPTEQEICRLYRTSSDAAGRRLNKVISILEMAHTNAPPEVAALVYDALAEIQTVQQRLTRVCAAGVRADPRHYLSGLINEWKEKDDA